MRQKTIMISARIPEVLMCRVDFAVSNTESKGVVSRSDAVVEALEDWAAKQEKDIKSRGAQVPKTS